MEYKFYLSILNSVFFNIDGSLRCVTRRRSEKSPRQKAQQTGLRLNKELVTTLLCVAHCMQCVSFGSEQRMFFGITFHVCIGLH